MIHRLSDFVRQIALCTAFLAAVTALAATEHLEASAESSQKGVERQRKEEELRRLSLEIERRSEDGTRYVTSVTPEPSLKEYVKTYTGRLAALGTEKFPEKKGKPVYGRVQMMLTVDSKGRLEKAELVEPADAFLVAHSRKLLQRMAREPFPPDFPPGTRHVIFFVPFNYVRD